MFSFAFAANAEDIGIWNNITTLSGGAKFLVAPSKIRIDKAAATIKILMLINEPTTRKAGKVEFRSWIINYTADCKKEVGVLDKVEWWTGEFGEGKMVRTEGPSTETLSAQRPQGAVALALCHENFK